uniref:Uncharacterized protein n=1 Tax=Arundo donax TaxID=35708 RepID=A0A0A9CPM9_ARUDO
MLACQKRPCPPARVGFRTES